MKFKFKADDCGFEYSVSFEADTWLEAVNMMPQFLRGCGFFVDDEDISARDPLEKSYNWYDDDINDSKGKEEETPKENETSTDTPAAS